MRKDLCGPICVREVLSRAGIDADVDELAELAGVDSSGTSLEGLARAAEAKGFRAGLLWLDDPLDLAVLLRELDLPVIAHVFSSHFVLVESIGEEKVLLYDPSFHKVECSLERFRSIWRGVAMAFYREG